MNERWASVLILKAEWSEEAWMLVVILTENDPKPTEIQHRPNDEELVADGLDAGLRHLHDDIVPDPA